MKPFEPQVDYTKVHNALFKHYTKLPDFNPDHVVMYTVLMSYYNEQYGYAFPTKAELALRLNCGINKPAKLAKVLEKYGLIKCVPRYHAQIGSNDIYYVYAPITSTEEFRKTFRQECELYDEKATRFMTRNLKDEALKVDEVVSGKAPELDGWL